MLDRAAIEADFAPVVALFELSDEAAGWGEMPAEMQPAAMVKSMEVLAGRNEVFFDRHDYSWALEPDGYLNPLEAWLQFETLAVLSEMDDDHPSLATHRPTAVKVLPLLDFASTSAAGDRCDYIVISSAHFSLTREYAIVLRRLHERASAIGAFDGLDRSDEWVHLAVSAMAAEQRDDLGELLRPLQSHAIALSRGKAPASPELLQDWLTKEIEEGGHLGIEIALTYHAMDRFLLYHELAHCLAGDLVGVERSRTGEIDADAGALSLMTVRIGSRIDRSPELSHHQALPFDLVFGGPNYLNLLRIVLLFSGVYRATAHFADQALAPSEGAIVGATRAGIAEIESRLSHLPLIVASYGMKPIAPKVLLKTASLQALFDAVRAKLLTDAGESPEGEPFAPFDLEKTMGRILETAAEEPDDRSQP